MMRKPAPRSLPELTRCTLLSSTLIDWLRLRSTKSSTKSAPDRSARLITLSTRDCSSSGISLSVAAFPSAPSFKRQEPHQLLGDSVKWPDVTLGPTQDERAFHGGQRGRRDGRRATRGNADALELLREHGDP